jgi:hypothetical protein
MLFADQTAFADAYQVISVLGYSLLPIVVLAFLSIVVNLHGWLFHEIFFLALFHLCPNTGYFGAVLGIVCSAWCTRSATSIFETVLGMQQQRYLIAYPISIFYGAFVLFTIFR